MNQDSGCVLPVEILDYIFSFLQGDKASLKACVNVNPLFLDVAEKYIYSYITVHNEQNSERDRYTPAHLCKILQEKRHIATYVQSLRIVISAPSVMRWFITRSLNDEDIATVFPLLPLLRKVTLTTRRNGMVAWPRIHPNVRSAFLQTLHLPSMEEFGINSIDSFPLAALDSCSSLKRLTIEEITTVDLQSTFEHTSPRPCLESISIRRFSLALSDILDWLHKDSSPDITCLGSIDFQSMGTEDVNRVPLLLQQCSNSLTELVLDPGNAFHTTRNLGDRTTTLMPAISHLSLSSLPRLKSLTIRTRIWLSQEFWVSSTGEETLESRSLLSPLAWTAQVLQTLPAASSLERLVLHIHFKVDRASLLEVDWDTLEQAVASDALKHLKSVEIWVPHHDARERKLGSIKVQETLRQDHHLSRLVEKGLLVIKEESDTTRRYKASL